jgi:hypothetical protein
MAVGVIHGADDELGLLLREVMVRVGVGSGYGRHHRRRKTKKEHTEARLAEPATYTRPKYNIRSFLERDCG